MLDSYIFKIINYLCCFPSEIVSLLTLLVCGFAILLALYWYGLTGLFVYQVLAVIVGNIQVLQISHFDFLNEPMALGNVVFATTFIVSDVITQHYGQQKAKQKVNIAFWAQLIVTLLMVLSLGHNPKIVTSDTNLQTLDNKNYASLLNIFTPSLRILLASLLAYFLSQRFIIFFVVCAQKVFDQRLIWLRQNLGMFLAGLLDTFIFTFCAWIVFSSSPVEFSTLWKTYVLPSILFRFFIAPLSTPFIYATLAIARNTKYEKV